MLDWNSILYESENEMYRCRTNQRSVACLVIVSVEQNYEN